MSRVIHAYSQLHRTRETTNVKVNYAERVAGDLPVPRVEFKGIS